MNQKGFAPIVIIITILALAALGGAGYVLVRKNVKAPAGLPEIPRLGRPPALGLSYIKYEYDKPTILGGAKLVSSQIVVYDPRNGSKKIIKEYGGTPGITIESLGGISSSFTSKKGREFLYILRDSTGVTDTGTPYTSIIKVDLDGNTQELVRFASERILATLVSPSHQKLVYCNDGGSLTLNDLVTGEKKVFDVEACRLTAYRLTFSRDETKLYYIRSFYELYGDYTEEEIKNLSRKAGNGLRSIDLGTGKDTLVIPYESLVGELFVFWSEPHVNLDQKILVVKANNNAFIEVKRLQNINFDYLAVEEINRLETVQKLEMPGRYFQADMLSVVGDGIFYLVSPSGERYTGGNEMGFFEIAIGKNNFPLPFALKEPVPRPPPYAPFRNLPSLFASLSKDASLYSVLIEQDYESSVGQSEQRLYQLSADGQEKLIDTAKFGYFTFFATPNL